MAAPEVDRVETAMPDREHGSRLSLSVVVPVYNGQATLVELADRLHPVLKGASKEFELILVNDGSTDSSWQSICDLAQRYSWIRGLDLMRNYGQHNALLTGIRLAQYQVIVTLDDDLQNPPEEIPTLLSHLGQGHDVVYGTPMVEQHGVWRNMASRVTKLALKGAMGVDIARDVSAFRAFRSHVCSAFAAFDGPAVNLDVLLTWGTTRFDSVDVQHHRRKRGGSNYTLRKLVVHAVNMVTGFSTQPLRLTSGMGFAFTLIGMGLFAYLILRYLIDGVAVPGFLFLASSMVLFSGAQMFALGIIGEYLASIHRRSMARPISVVRRMTGQRTNKRGGE